MVIIMDNFQNQDQERTRAHNIAALARKEARKFTDEREKQEAIRRVNAIESNIEGNRIPLRAGIQRLNNILEDFRNRNNLRYRMQAARQLQQQQQNQGLNLQQPRDIQR